MMPGSWSWQYSRARGGCPAGAAWPRDRPCMKRIPRAATRGILSLPGGLGRPDSACLAGYAGGACLAGLRPAGLA